MNTIFSKAGMMVLVVLSSLFATSCEDTFLSLSDNITTVEKNLDGYSKIEVSDAFNVEVNLGQDNEFITIVANENLHPYIETTVSNNTLVIKMKNFVRYRSRATLKVYVNADAVNEFKISGATKLSLGSKLTSENVIIEASGASDFQGLIDADKARIVSDGASRVWLTGKLREMEANVSGASKLEDHGLNCEKVKIDLSGASNGYVTVSEELRANLSGASKLYYRGNPGFISNNITGSSTVTKVN